jgi:hypothetical protein
MEWWSIGGMGATEERVPAGPKVPVVQAPSFISPTPVGEIRKGVERSEAVERLERFEL